MHNRYDSCYQVRPVGDSVVTIAACFVTPEGVVLGADSTTTAFTPVGPHYFNHSQKVFEIGNGSTLGGVTWGLGGLVVNSHRSLFALLADDIAKKKPKSVEEVARRWVDQFWAAYTTSSVVGPLIAECKTLGQKKPYDPAGAPDARTQDEETRYRSLKNDLVAGFCIGGYLPQDRVPAAFVTLFDPIGAKPAPTAVVGWSFWGAPNIVQRLIFGYDDNLKDALLKSGKWAGTNTELDALLAQQMLAHPIILPIRDAADFVYSCIAGTIKALKFSNLSQICGGPIELAVITADRPFRWVRHKAWDSAIAEGGE
jgi:hypothetical protein